MSEIIYRQVPPDRVPELEQQIARLARLADRAGLEPPILRAAGDPRWIGLGAFGKRRIVDCVISWPGDLALPGGWQWLGAVDHRAGGILAGEVPADLRQPDPYHCDHCGRAVRRNVTHYARNEAGEILQLGGDCLAQYTGIDGDAITGYWLGVQGLAEPDLDSWGMDPDGEPDGYGRADFVTIACGLIKQFGYRKANDPDGSTADGVADLYIRCGFKFAERYPAEAAEARAQVETYRERYTDTAQAVISWAEGLDQRGSEYLYNVNRALSSPVITRRTENIAASGCWAYLREQGERREAAAAPATRQAMPATTGQRYTLRITVEQVREVASLYGNREIVKGFTDQGAICFWCEPGRFREGGVYDIKGTAKGINEFRGRTWQEFNRVAPACGSWREMRQTCAADPWFTAAAVA